MKFRVFLYYEKMSQQSLEASVLITNLHPAVDEQKLLATFCRFGGVQACKVLGAGHGLIQFASLPSAQKAIESAQRSLLKVVLIEPQPQPQFESHEPADAVARWLSESVGLSEYASLFREH